MSNQAPSNTKQGGFNRCGGYRGLAYICRYHGFGVKKTSTYRSPETLRRYCQRELDKLQRHFGLEIERIKSLSEYYPIADDITFSQIDAEEIMVSLEEGMGVTKMRILLRFWGERLQLIARDLEEEIELVKIFGQENEED